jgi:hypothetical protein
MSDKFLAGFWREAPAPWNELGPSIAKKMMSPESLQLSPLAELARLFRQERMKRGWGQAQVAIGAGLPLYVVSRLEQGRAGKDDSGWSRLAEFYGGPAMQLYNSTTGPDPGRTRKGEPEPGLR